MCVVNVLTAASTVDIHVVVSTYLTLSVISVMNDT